ncbi:MAG: CNNM domain-containing protein, partial [Pseudomonadota bacterium]
MSGEITGDIILMAATILGLLVLSGFFSGSETALTATSKARMHKLEKDGVRRAAAVNRLIDDRETLIGAILLGNNLVNILASALATSMFLTLFGESGVAYATLVMTALVLIFAEVLPKTVSITAPDRAAMLVAPLIAVIVRAFGPVVALVQLIVRGALKMMGVNIEAGAQVLSGAEEIRGAIELHHETGEVVKGARDMLGGVLDLSEVRVDEIMVHRKNMNMIDIDQPCGDVVEQVLASPHTRL